ncbi:MAG: nucleoside permease [Paludibacter sp.]|nr:nucleoside permease [Paludibacter sp.]
MGLKFRLILMNFLQFFIWGSWLITIGGYWFQNKGWTGTEFGAIFSTMGIASLFMPALAGVIADRWVNAEKLLGVFHLSGAVCLFLVPLMKTPTEMFELMLVNMMFYMPTISLSITVSYSAMKKTNMDVVKEYPPIRVFGTIGFIVAMWTVSLLKFETSSMQFYVASISAFILGIYAFTLPKCEVNKNVEKKTLVDTLGLKAFTLFKEKKMALFFIFSMLLGAALQLTNAYGDTFLHDFAKIDAYKGMVAIKYPAIIMSISQMSETLFILTIPFFLRRFGIKNVMLFSMFAWVLRFGLFGLGNPADGLWMIILSCVVYGMAFDFFNISGSLYVETNTDSSIRASAQGVFMMMTNGVGAILGSSLSGLMIDNFFKAKNGDFQWQGIWFTFAAYALIVAVLFAVFFKHKHDPNELQNINH